MNRLRTWKYLNVVMAILLPLTSGCQVGVSRWWYFGKEKPEQEHYREVASEIDYPDVVEPTAEGVEGAAPPRTIATEGREEIWDMKLQEAVHLALANNDIIRSTGQFLSIGNTILNNPTGANSVYDPAIQASGVLFGGVGTEAALADFDTNWTTSMFWGRNETIQNSPFGGGVNGSTLATETANFYTGLSKQMAYGAQLTVGHEMNYNGSNSPNVLFNSVYTGNVQAEYRQQLLAGAGPEFVKVAGPLSPQFASIAGVSNGVLIARINQDISITNFEANIRNLVKDVEDTYWDLYLAYRTFDTAVTARNAALHTWRNAKAKWQAGGALNFRLQDEAQSRDRYFETRAQVENSLGNLYSTEQRFRSLLGISVNDRKIIRPADTPVAAKIHADWYHSMAEALTERVELRRQKWNIKSLELQLGAAKNFARPRLDVIARYRVNAFGDQLLDYDGAPLGSAYESLTAGDQTGWDLGLEMSMPIGLRLAKTQVQNIELRLAKARKVLAAQELEIGHELAVSFQDLEKSYATAVSNYNRRQAAMDRFRIESTLVEGGTGSVDLNLRAQESLATAAVAYHQSIVDYNKAIVNLYFRKGTLLQEDNIHLVEGRWDPEAYKQAYERAKARANGIPAPHLKTLPAPFAADGHIHQIGFAGPEAAGQGNMEIAPEPEVMSLPVPSPEVLNDPPLDPAVPEGAVPAVPGEAPAASPAVDSPLPAAPALEAPMAPEAVPSVPAAQEGVQRIETRLPVGESSAVVPAWAAVPAPSEIPAPVVPRTTSSSGKAALSPPVENAPAAKPVNSNDGWQLRKEGWGLNDVSEDPFPIQPAANWQTGSQRTSSQVINAGGLSKEPPQRAGNVALEIGDSVPEYRP